jgi:hypothetical protein
LSTRSTIATGYEWPRSQWHLFEDGYEESGTLMVRVDQDVCDGNYADDLDGVNVRLTPKLIAAIVEWDRKRREPK